MNIKCSPRKAYQLCQQKLGPYPDYLNSNQTRSVSGTAQSTNDAPTFTEQGTLTGPLTTALQKAAQAGLSLCPCALTQRWPAFGDSGEAEQRKGPIQKLCLGQNLSQPNQ